jgi:hypothetical protein
MQIKMVTDQVSELREKLLQLSRDTFERSDQILSSSDSNIWQGSDADEFMQRIRAVCNRLHLLAEDATKLGYAVSQEQEEWIKVDQEGVNRFKGIRAVPRSPQASSLDIELDKFSNNVENFYFDHRYKEFKKWWETQNLDGKKKYLQDLQNRMADRYDWPRMLVVIDNLPDVNGDSRGLNLGKLMLVDVDNMNTDEPWRLIETAFHETRHEFQRDVVINFQNNGQIPDGMTQKQVKKWVYELTDDHYINGEDNFADYYHQAIETDARKYGDIVMKNVLEEMGNNGASGGGSAW